MSTYSNYSDDIRMYDNDPRSPFYKEPPECEECGALMEREEPDEDGGGFMYCTNSECETNE